MQFHWRLQTVSFSIRPGIPHGIRVRITSSHGQPENCSSLSCLPASSPLILSPSPFRSSDLLEFSSGALEPAAQRRGANVYGSLRFASVTLSEGTRTTQEAQVFTPADQIQVEFTPGGSTPSLAHKNTKSGADRPGYERV